MIPNLVTQRLEIRLQADIDPKALLAYYIRNKAFHAPWSPLRPQTFYQAKEIERSVKKGHAGFKFCLLSEGKPIGLVTVSGIECGALMGGYLGFSLDEAAQGKGLMFEALSALIPHIFTKPICGQEPLHRLMAAHMPDNTRSAALLARLGFQREGFAKAYLRIAGQWEDHVLTSLINPGSN